MALSGPRRSLRHAAWWIAGVGASASANAWLPLPVENPFRSTLAMLPFIVAGFVALQDWADRHGNRRRPAGWIAPATAALVLATLSRDRLALTGLDFALAGGFAVLLVARTIGLLLALRPALGTRLPRRPAWPFFALPFLFYVAILPWSSERRAPDGDEPYYLLVTHSLAYDFDSDLANNYAAEDSRAFMPRALEPQPGDPVGPQGQKYSRHNEALPVLLAPGYRLFGKAGALVTMAALTALLAWLTLRVARHYTAEHPGETLWSYGIVAFASPFVLYSGQAWVEVPAALLGLIAIDQIRDLRGHRSWGTKQWIGIALPVLLLPLVKLRFVLLAGPLLALAWWHAGRPRKPLLVVAGLLSVLLAGVLVHNLLVFGNPLKIHTLEEVDPTRYTPANVWRGAFGLLFDSAFGLVPFFPLWLLAVPALWRGAKTRAGWLFDLTAATGPYLLMLLPRREWFGGWSPPFRYALIVLPLLAVSLVPILADRRRFGPRVLIAALTAPTLVALVVWLLVPGWTYNFADGRTYVLDAVSSQLGADVARFFVSGTRPAAALWLLPPIALVATLALWSLGRRPARRSAQALGLLLAVLAAAAVPLAARRWPSHVVELEDPWVTKTGGHIHPDRWTFDRPLYRGGWTLRGGERVEAPVVAGGDRLAITVSVEYVRNTPAPIALVVLRRDPDGREERLGSWSPTTPRTWEEVAFGPFPWQPGATLILAAEGPASTTPLAGLILDRATLTWP